jgi:hypothetical protein
MRAAYTRRYREKHPEARKREYRRERERHYVGLALEFGKPVANVIRAAKRIDVEIGRLRQEREALCERLSLCRVCIRRECEYEQRTCRFCGRAVRGAQ